MMAGRPTLSSASTACATPAAISYLPPGSFGADTMVARGFSSPIRSIASRKSARSSAISMADRWAPISSTWYFSSVPRSASASAVFSAVCPPIVGSSASGRSAAMIFSTTSGVIGSM